MLSLSKKNYMLGITFTILARKASGTCTFEVINQVFTSSTIDTWITCTVIYIFITILASPARKAITPVVTVYILEQ